MGAQMFIVPELVDHIISALDKVVNLVITILTHHICSYVCGILVCSVC